MRVLIALLLIGMFGVGAWFALSSDVEDRAPASLPTAIPVETSPAAPAPVDWADRGASLQVVVLEPDLITPAGGRALQLYAFTPRRMEAPRYVGTIRSAVDGVATGGELPVGSYIVCAPGANPGDASPWTARVTIGDGAPPVVRVVDGSSAVTLRVTLNAQFAPRYGVAPKLVFRRVDDRSGTTVLQPDVVKPGVPSFDVRLPAGRYEVDVEPLGELLVHDEQRVFDVAPGGAQERTIALADNPARIDVELQGIADDQLPARVFAQRVGDVAMDRPERTWWGPHRWHRRSMQVPALPGRFRVVVFGRDGVFRSVTDADLGSERAVIALEPATRLVIDQFAWVPGSDVGAVVTAAIGDEIVARTVAPRFGSEYPDLVRPALGGELIVPRAPKVHVELQRDDGATAWSRDVAADADTVRIRID